MIFPLKRPENRLFRFQFLFLLGKKTFHLCLSIIFSLVGRFFMGEQPYSQGVKQSELTCPDVKPSRQTFRQTDRDAQRFDGLVWLSGDQTGQARIGQHGANEH